MITKEQLQRSVEISNIALFYNKDGSEFQKALIAFAPEIESDIISSALDFNCSCTKKVKDYINDKRDLFIDFLIVLEEKNIVEIDLDYVENFYKPKDFSGKVAKTSIKDWPNFIKTLYSQKNLNFRNMHLIKENDDIYVFFA